MAKKFLRITSARPGFIRGGHPHPAEPTTYAADFFGKQQLAAIRAEPMLTVEDIDADDAGAVVQRAAPSVPITEQQFNEFVARMTADHEAALDAAVKQAVAEALEKAEADKEEAVAQAFEMAETEKKLAVTEALKNAGAEGSDGKKEAGGKSKAAAGAK